MLNGLPHTHVQRGACRREAQFSQSCQQHENATMSFQECGISLSSLLQVAEFLRIQHESARCVQWWPIIGVIKLKRIQSFENVLVRFSCSMEGQCLKEVDLEAVLLMPEDSPPYLKKCVSRKLRYCVHELTTSCCHQSCPLQSLAFCSFESVFRKHCDAWHVDFSCLCCDGV